MEVVVVLGIISLLAAIMTPIVLDYLEDAKRGKAQAECNGIYAALMKYNKDNNKWPGTKEETMYLYSAGTKPTDASAITVGGYTDSAGAGLAFADVSIELYPDYMESDPTDAWGNAYVVLVNGLLDRSSADRALILSAGPDGELNTDKTDTKPQGDDIGRRIK